MTTKRRQTGPVPLLWPQHAVYGDGDASEPVTAQEAKMEPEPDDCPKCGGLSCMLCDGSAKAQP